MESQGQRVRHECVVHKANVPLASGESLNAYTQKLSSDGRAYVMKQLNLTSLAKPAHASAYLVEAYSDKCIFDVYKYGGEGSSEYKYYAFSYTRKSDGKFEFKDLAEVERVISFQAKPPMSVTKAKKELGDEMEEEEEAEEMSKKPKKTKKKFAPGWDVKKTHVSWDGVL
jgi:hypothetical protein